LASREGIVARPESQRKALRAAFRLLGLALVSAIVSVPLAFTSTILMNPLLGRLEAKYGVELTGHSGPADWIFALVFAVTTVAVFTALVLATRRPRAVAPDDHHRHTE
jgi:hypothetical protein